MNKGEKNYIDSRTEDILQVILSYAQLDFKKQTRVSENEDVFDAIGAGVNMLGEELENSKITLEEKEHLLKEIHHRVKNNLQIISSLLNLQAEFVKDEKILALIRESQNRINAMALVHEMLYSSQNLSYIKFKNYLENLFQAIYRTFYPTENTIVLEISCTHSMELNIDKMIPLGLMFNEILTNSFKYAFSGKKNGTIKINCEKSKDKCRIEISDNGIGIPPSFDREEAKSLGIQLIYLLADQLDAELILDKSQGTKYTIIL